MKRLVCLLAAVMLLVGCGGAVSEEGRGSSHKKAYVFNMFGQLMCETEYKIDGSLHADSLRRVRVNSCDALPEDLSFSDLPLDEDGQFVCEGCVVATVDGDPVIGIPLVGDTVMVYIDEELSDAEAKSVGTRINALENVNSITFISREEALQNFTEDHEGDPAFEGVDVTALRHRFEVRLVDLSLMEETCGALADVEGVAKVLPVSDMVAWWIIPADSREEALERFGKLFNEGTDQNPKIS